MSTWFITSDDAFAVDLDAVLTVFVNHADKWTMRFKSTTDDIMLSVKHGREVISELKRRAQEPPLR